MLARLFKGNGFKRESEGDFEFIIGDIIGFLDVVSAEEGVYNYYDSESIRGYLNALKRNDFLCATSIAGAYWDIEELREFPNSPEHREILRDWHEKYHGHVNLREMFGGVYFANAREGA